MLYPPALVPASSSPPLRSVAEVADGLLDRARRQHREGVGRFSRARTGIEPVDALAHTWWGAILLTADVEGDAVTLAARVAVETARAGGPVLWLSLSSGAEGAVFRMLTGAARVRARRVFVERSLEKGEWRALEKAREGLAGLPISLCDAHGLTLEEVRAVVREQKATEAGLDLVVLQVLELGDRRLVRMAEGLAEEFAVPVLLLATSHRRELDGVAVDPDGAPVRPGTLMLHVERVGQAKRGPGPVAARLRVGRAREGVVGEVGLRVDPEERWVEGDSG